MDVEELERNIYATSSADFRLFSTAFIPAVSILKPFVVLYDMESIQTNKHRHDRQAKNFTSECSY
jgi:hypothetical protein